jgi:multidrug efflux pump subunit AcrA (membrane-fusion protein)
MTANPKSDTQPRKTRVGRNLILGVVLIACVIAGAYLVHQRKAQAQDATASEPSSPVERVSVVTTEATVRDFERALVVQGNLEAKSFAMVSPRVPGTIEAILVDEGDAVVAGKTKLFQIDAANLEKQVQIKQHETIVSQSSSKEAAANLERIKVDLHKAELDYHRFERLREKEAVTADAFEQQQSRYQQLQAALQLAQARVELEAAKEAQSKAELAIAQKDVGDAGIYAPIDGTVSVRFQEPGEMGSPGHPVLRIDDTSVVEVSAFLPAQYYAAVIAGQTAMRIQVSGIDIGRQIITYKSPTIDPKLRTFEIKCVLTDPPEGVTSGAMAQIVVSLENRRGLGVPSQAIQQRGGRSVVFVIENNVARQVPVATGIETDGWTEIREGDLKEGASVVSMGQYMVDAGSAVTVQQQEEE